MTCICILYLCDSVWHLICVFSAERSEVSFSSAALPRARAWTVETHTMRTVPCRAVAGTARGYSKGLSHRNRPAAGSQSISKFLREIELTVSQFLNVPAAPIEALPALTTTVVNLGDAGVVPPGYRVAGTGNIIARIHAQLLSVRAQGLRRGRQGVGDPAFANSASCYARRTRRRCHRRAHHPRRRRRRRRARQPASSEPATSEPAAAAAATLAEPSIRSSSQESDLWSVCLTESQDGSQVD